MDRNIKQQIIKDWQKKFPQFGVYSISKLYKIVGCLVVGIDLIKLPFTQGYRPHFVVYTLYGNRLGNDIKSCLSAPILMDEFYDKKKKQYNISYLKHKDYFDNIAETIREKEYLFAEKNIPLAKILSLFDDYAKKPPQNAHSNSFMQATIQEDKLKVALYTDSQKAKEILFHIKQKKWDNEHFEQFGVNVKDWTKKLEDTIISKDSFLKQIDINKNDKKIIKLPYSEIIV